MNSWILCWIKEVIPTRDIPYESIYIKSKIMGTITRRTKLRVPWETERRTLIEKGIEGVWSVAGNTVFLDQGGGYLIQFSSVTQSCPTLCDSMNRSLPGLPVSHQLPEFTQTHVHWVGDAISSSVIPFSSCPQSFPASGSFPMSQLFTWGGQSIGVSASASVLPMNT